jgi:predicted porin
MKKSLIALAVLAASGAAMAQSSVTLFGIVDTGIGYVNHDATGSSRYGVGTSGNATSRLGLRGTEDLGGGLKAGFWLEGEVFGDDGNASGLNFKRESTVRLSGNFGEVRLGRETTPTFRTSLKYDVFGATGIGQFMGYRDWAGNKIADSDTIRANNMVSYSSPNFNGFTANISYAFDEKANTVAGNNKIGRYVGGNVGYDNGPLSVTLAYGTVKSAANFGGLLDSADRDEVELGASYNFGVAKLTGLAQQVKYKADNVGASGKFNNYMIGVSAPVGGVGEVKAQYAYYDQKGFNTKAQQLSLGYVHNLSKRTALYGTVAFMKNNGANDSSLGSNLGLQAKGVYKDTVAYGQNQTGVQVGIRHAF